MLQWEKDVILQNYKFLVVCIPTEQVVTRLNEMGIFSNKDCTTIAQSRKPNRSLLYLLEKRGPNAFSVFLSSLTPEILHQLKTLENDISKLEI